MNAMNNKITITLKEKFIKSAETAKSISENFGIDYFEVCKLLNEIQGADVQEVKHGHWIKTEDFTMIEQYAVYEYECSKCGAHAHYGIDNYCYHCGAKMDGDKR